VSTIETLAGLGVTQFIECGPGKVLAGLARRIDKRPELQIAALETVDQFATIQEALT
jgi:[acyl-carrier-protein] S-malonyltransferase